MKKRKYQKPKIKPGPMRAAFPAALKEARLSAGVPQTVLASAVGIGVAYLSMLENGRRCPPLDTVDALATALRVKPARLLGLGR